MTIRQKIECDADKCTCELDVSDCNNHEVFAAYSGWHEDPNYACYHYCPTCWPKVSKELEDAEGE